MAGILDILLRISPMLFARRKHQRVIREPCRHRTGLCATAGLAAAGSRPGLSSTAARFGRVPQSTASAVSARASAAAVSGRHKALNQTGPTAGSVSPALSRSVNSQNSADARADYFRRHH